MANPAQIPVGDKPVSRDLGRHPVISLAFAFPIFVALRSGCRMQGKMMGALEEILPDELKNTTMRPGNELVLPYDEALRAIEIATAQQIAVLGFEAFQVRKDGLLTVDYTGYDRDISFAGDWPSYVAANNVAAEKWIRNHRYGAGYGYILTSTSEAEFAANTLKFGSPEKLADRAIADLLRRFRQNS